MISIPFDKDMIESAHEMANEMGSINNSITHGAGNAAGFLGEIAIRSYLGAPPMSTKDYDFIYNGDRIEVKTKRRTVKPLSHYDVSVAKVSGHQEPDWYCFLSLEFKEKINGGYYNIKNVWYLGLLSYSDFWSKATKWEQGQVDESNWFVTHADMYNVPISELKMKGRCSDG